MWRSYSAAQPGTSPSAFPSSAALYGPSSRASFELGDDDARTSLTFSNGNSRGSSGQSPFGQSDPVDNEEAAQAYLAWQENHPCLLTHFESFKAAVEGKRLAVFLDYDGTLTPIVSNPDDAKMSDEMRDVVRAVARSFPTAIISGRGREKVEAFVQLKEIFYAGSHGMDIAGPRVDNNNNNNNKNDNSSSASSSSGNSGNANGNGSGCNGQRPSGEFQAAFQPAAHFRPLIDEIFEELRRRLKDIPGSSVEHNTFCVSAHFRNCPGEAWQDVISTVEQVVSQHDDLRMTRGRKVVEIRPKVNWHKGTALTHLVEALGLAQQPDVVAIYVGDDHTDEDAFRTLEETRQGFGILVSTRAKPTRARFTVRDPACVKTFLSRIVDWSKSGSNGWHANPCCNGWSMAAEPVGSGSGPAREPGAAAGPTS
ncbi:hypothetical protein PLESTB_001464700 [Pleodorina starrii]|uniref:Trehalose 6-phosphate phosphatase n=1 Tax=Pleodorina starrii TaxID=330485 RepID=A0A9W6F7I9_9CHLO|nr:hypothetical protein PLESTM_001682800 [Pleodorina starrii]GLC59233.1 hypothetical protein PLESTB_001464700 [Pleodorina starrii]GLC74797.1 hypothetical protein PLESTF_001557200 [Pleodorina starrii]